LSEELPAPLRVALLLARELDALDIRYMVGGSVASSIHGEPRATDDVDLVVRMTSEQADPLVRRLAPVFFIQIEAVREAVTERGSFNLIHLESMQKADIFVLSGEEFPRQALERSAPVVIQRGTGASLVVPSPEDVVLQKLVWFRKGGEASDRQWRDVLGVLKTQSGRLDRSHLDVWARKLGIEDLFERAMGQAGLESPV
jgi:hypothetical protein